MNKPKRRLERLIVIPAVALLAVFIIPHVANVVTNLICALLSAIEPARRSSTRLKLSKLRVSQDPVSTVAPKEPNLLFLVINPFVSISYSYMFTLHFT